LQTDEKILVYFEKHNEVEQLQPGDNITFSTKPRLIKNYGNPFEFDYKKYLERKNIYRQLYLSANNWENASTISKPTLTIRAEQFREKLLEIYRNQNLGKNELEILSALTLGYKRDLDRETKRVFSASGAMHILAVSGLHVGIVFWVITLLFGFLRKQKSGRLLFVIISIVLLWSYTYITGLSPSVMRASTMFTIFVIGENINRKPNSYNSLAASALFLLLFNPNNLFEVGFQLSYSAVFGILFLQPKLSKLITVNNKFLKFLWTLLTISIAAQIATFPITTFYFNQFPTYFWITNLFIIPAVMILIPLGILLLIVAKVPILSTAISAILQFIIKWCYAILSQIEQFPFSVHEVSVHPIQLFFLLAALFSLYLFLKSHRAKFVKAILVSILLISITSFAIKIIRNKTTEVIVYNNPKNPTIQLIRGKTNFVISEFKPDDSSNILNSIRITNHKLKLDNPIYITFEDSLKNNFLFEKNRILIFEGKTILFNTNISNFEKPIFPDFIVNPKQYNVLESQITKNTSVVLYTRNFQKENSDFNRIYRTANMGAFIEKW
jgi:competence protein ComEC